MSFKIQKNESIMNLQSTPVQIKKIHWRSMRPSVFLNDINFIGEQQRIFTEANADKLPIKQEELHLPLIQAPKLHSKNKLSMPDLGIKSPMSKQVSPTSQETFENILSRKGSVTERVPIFQRVNSKGKLFKKLEPIQKHVEFNQNVTEIDTEQGVQKISTIHEGFVPLTRTHFHLKHLPKQ